PRRNARQASRRQLTNSVRKERDHPPGQRGGQAAEGLADLLDPVALREVGQDDRFVLEESGAFAEVLEVEVLVVSRAVAVLGLDERALDQEHARLEQLRRGLEDRGAAVPRVSEERRLLPSRHLGALRSQRGDLFTGQAEELIPEFSLD